MCHGDAGHLVTWRKVEQIVAAGLAEKKDALCRAEQGTAAYKAWLTGAPGQAEQRTAAG